MAKEDVKLLITADGQKAINEIQKVTQNMGGLGSGINTLLGTASSFANWQTAAVGAITAAGAAFGKLLVDAVNTADELANMSKRTGVAVESLSRLSYVAKMSDLDMGTLQKSMKFLNTALYDVSRGNQAAIDKFKEFGIQVFNADGTVKNAEQALIASAEAYSRLENDAAKTALATQIFGKAGQELMPMLSEGAAGIKALTQEAESMGMVVSEKAAAAAEAFNDKLDKMKMFAQGVAIQVMENLVPNLNSLTTEMDEFNRSGSAMKQTADNITTAFNIIKSAAENITLPLRTVLTMINYSANTTPTGTQKSWYSNMMMTSSQNNSTDPNAGGKGGITTGGGKGGGKTSIPGVDFPLINNLEDILMNNGIYGEGIRASYINQAATAGVILNKVLAQGGNVSGIIPSAFSGMEELMSVSNPMFDPNILKDRQQPLIDQWAKYYEELQELGTANFLIMNDTTQMLFGGMGDAITGIGNLMSSMAGKTQQDYQAMFEIGKAFKSAEIVTSTYTAAVKAYESQVGIPIVGPGLAVAAAASAIAFGTAQLANLWTAQPGQGSINGGGTSASPSYATRSPQGGSGGGSNRTIVIKYEGLIYGDKDRLARDLIASLDKAERDGVGRGTRR